MLTRRVYALKFASSRDYSELAMACQMRNGHLCFISNRGHMIKGEVVQDGDRYFRFRSDGFDSGIWEFRMMTVEDYKRGWCTDIPLPESIETPDELEEWFFKTFGEEPWLYNGDYL